MNEKLKEAFDEVQAEDQLKRKTKEFVFQKTKGYTQHRFTGYKYIISAFACMALFLLGGRWVYFTPTVEISIDINPSVELGVNRFNRIISFESYNDDGQELVDSLDIKFMDYSEAVNQIVESEDITSLLSDGEILTIAVVAADNLQSQKIFSNIQSCTEEKNNTYCWYVHSEEVEKAHESGLSYGKYKAFLEVQKLDPGVTVEEIQNMTMREIRDLINELSDDGENGTDYLGNSNRQGEKQKGRGRKQAE